MKIIKTFSLILVSRIKGAHHTLFIPEDRNLLQFGLNFVIKQVFVLNHIVFKNHIDLVVDILMISDWIFEMQIVYETVF